ncbi:MAG: sigma-70 family RNA polymerase sigma factor [Clostridia bacterium]|nr:sigma-70 family RNA polymerase sigma factor [Clostridia bacterium]MBR5365536.1 sigma-70 family RNA polymerase sigma factor [Clostridia bacterium]
MEMRVCGIYFRFLPCPICGVETRTKVLRETVLVRYPLFCAKYNDKRNNGPVIMLFFLLALAAQGFPLKSPAAAPPGIPDAPDDGDEAAVLALVERARNGDDDAFSDLVSRYERFVFNTAVRVLSASAQSPDLADDIAQEAFIKAWRNLAAFRGDCTFSTWLYRIAVNCAKDTIRAASRRPAVSLSSLASDDGDEDGEEWDVPVTSGETIPEEAAERRELILAVRRAVESLPDEQRQVIVLRDLSGLSYQEISEKLGLELGTVKSRINRGRQNLKTILENGNFF